jgi:hypothetical protein
LRQDTAILLESILSQIIFVLTPTLDYFDIVYTEIKNNTVSPLPHKPLHACRQERDQFREPPTEKLLNSRYCCQ